MRGRSLDGWDTSDRRDPGGAVGSTQRLLAGRALVDPSDEGARRLCQGYWLAVRRASGGLVRPQERDGRIDVLLLGLPPALLRLEQSAVTAGWVGCSFRIAGGLLARRAGGTLAVFQGEAGELHVVVDGFVPRLGLVWRVLQRRFHVAISRRYFRRLLAEADA